MLRSLLTLFTLLILLLLSGCAHTAGQPVTLAIVNGLLIDGSGADPLPNGVVLISGDTITAVGPAGKVRVPAGCKVLDVEGAAILPGLINAHVHRGFDTSNLKAWAQGGVTTVRDEGAWPGKSLKELVQFRDEANRDPGNARLVSAGLMMTVPGGYGNLYVSSPEEARQKSLEELEAGIDLLKVSLEDGYAGASGLPKLSAEELAAIVKAAHERGTLVSGHITQSAYLRPLLDAGVDDIAHVPYDAVSDDDFQQMVEQGTTLVPTFTVFRNYGAPVTTCQANLRKFIKLGGLVALGNDYGGGPGAFELGIPMYEIEMMAGAGMTPMQVIQAATLNAARVLNLDGKIGLLAPGQAADVLVVASNPLDDLQALRQVLVVVHNGTVIRSELE